MYFYRNNNWKYLPRINDSKAKFWLSNQFSEYKASIRDKFGARNIVIGESVQNKILFFFLKNTMKDLEYNPKIIWIKSEYKTSIPNVELLVVSTMTAQGKAYLLAWALVWKKKENQSFWSIIQNYLNEWHFIDPSLVIWNYDKRIIEIVNKRLASKTKLLVLIQSLQSKFIEVIHNKENIPSQIKDEIVVLIFKLPEAKCKKQFNNIWNELKVHLDKYFNEIELELIGEFKNYYEFSIKSLADWKEFHWEMISSEFNNSIDDVVKNKIWIPENDTPLKILESFNKNMIIKIEFDEINVQNEDYQKIFDQIEGQIHYVCIAALNYQMSLIKEWNITQSHIIKVVKSENYKIQDDIQDEEQIEGEVDALENSQIKYQKLNHFLCNLNGGMFYEVIDSEFTKWSWNLREIQGYPWCHILITLEFLHKLDAKSIIMLWDSVKWHKIENISSSYISKFRNGFSIEQKRNKYVDKNNKFKINSAINQSNWKPNEVIEMNIDLEALSNNEDCLIQNDSKNSDSNETLINYPTSSQNIKEILKIKQKIKETYVRKKRSSKLNYIENRGCTSFHSCLLLLLYYFEKKQITNIESNNSGHSKKLSKIFNMMNSKEFNKAIKSFETIEKNFIEGNKINIAIVQNLFKHLYSNQINVFIAEVIDEKKNKTVLPALNILEMNDFGAQNWPLKCTLLKYSLCIDRWKFIEPFPKVLMFVLDILNVKTIWRKLNDIIDLQEWLSQTKEPWKYSITAIMTVKRRTTFDLYLSKPNFEPFSFDDWVLYNSEDGKLNWVKSSQMMHFLTLDKGMYSKRTSYLIVYKKIN